MDRQEILAFIKQHDLQPIHGRGQNYLCDPSVVVRMIEVADVREGDSVLEVGPGPGVLTEELIGQGAKVLAVELDTKLARLLEERLGGKTLDVINADIMDSSNAELFERMGEPEKGYKVVANLPYSITSDILRRFVTEEPKPSSFTVMVQREVADRITAKPPKMSLLSVVIQLYGEPRKIVNVPASSFHPKPKVDSAVLHVSLRSKKKLQEITRQMDPEEILKVASLGFSEKRKQLKNTLSRRFPKDVVESALSSAKIVPSERPERLTVEDWVRLSTALIS
jgi:16S rRNA (adenine1518-N6/adenine1519-N6)-dimethyltransferase